MVRSNQSLVVKAPSERPVKGRGILRKRGLWEWRGRESGEKKTRLKTVKRESRGVGRAVKGA